MQERLYFSKKYELETNIVSCFNFVKLETVILSNKLVKRLLVLLWDSSVLPLENMESCAVVHENRFDFDAGLQSGLQNTQCSVSCKNISLTAVAK